MRHGGLALVLFAAGCGGGATVPLSDFGPRFAAAECARVFRCCSVAQVQALYGSSVTDESACVAQLTPVGQFLSTQVQEEQSAGRVRYDGAAAATCFQKVGTAPCTPASNDLTSIPPCDEMFVALVATGGVCAGDSECQTGFCDRPLVNDSEGVCAIVPSKGMPCTRRCAAGATCDTVAGMCVDPMPDGSFCIVDEDCLSGNCDNPNLTGGTCAAPSGPTCGPAA
jgi:hypothetical protein